MGIQIFICKNINFFANIDILKEIYMINRDNKKAITKKGMISNRLNKFSIEESIL